MTENVKLLGHIRLRSVIDRIIYQFFKTLINNFDVNQTEAKFEVVFLILVEKIITKGYSNYNPKLPTQSCRVS